MDNRKNIAKSSGVGLTTVIQTVFIILKLTNLISWPWQVVLLPTIIPTGIAVIALGTLGVAVVVRKNKVKKVNNKEETKGKEKSKEYENCDYSKYKSFGLNNDDIYSKDKNQSYLQTSHINYNSSIYEESDKKEQTYQKKLGTWKKM